MKISLSEDLHISLTVAIDEAKRMGHEYAGLEHLLYALTFDEETAEVLKNAGANLGRVRETLTEYLAEELESLGSNGGAPPRLTLGVQRVLSMAAARADSTGRGEITGPDVLVAMFDEADSYAVQVLEDGEVSRLDVVSFLAHGVSKIGQPPYFGGPASGASGMPAGDEEDDDEPGPRGGSPAGDPLKAFAQDLTELARRGGIDPLIGRDKEVLRTLHILQRRRKNNPIYVGDPGVGKTALVEGLALRIAQGEVPAPFRDTRVFRLDLGALIAGTRYRGDFENRLKAVLAALAKLASPVLFIDEIHTVVGAGSAGRGTMDASNLLKPALQDGTLRCIGATTWEEYRQTFSADQALARRFQKVELTEPSIEETTKILTGLKERYEKHHGVVYTPEAIDNAALLADRYMRDRRLPDKAIDLMDEAGAAVALRGREAAEPEERPTPPEVTEADLEEVLATMAQVPPRRVKGGDKEQLRQLESELKARVYGQDEAIERLVSAIKVSRAGLRDGQKPVGAFLLTGPTGVGKTEVAKRLAEVLGISFLRFDMSEYMESHSVSRLVGAPPGYVGFDRGGLLTEAVAKSPHAVLLLDEIEKAHPDIFNILLQVMDHGTLTDSNGKPTDFRHVILLMTSNVGARELAARSPGFLHDTHDADGMPARPHKDSDSDRAVERLFSPEFRNRLDARLRFNPLSPLVMEQIVDKFIRELSLQLAEKKVRVEITEAARKRLAEKGFDPTFGARPLGRVIEETVKRPLTDEILFGQLENGGTATVDVAAGEIVMRYSEVAAVETVPATETAESARA
jgi:ATP-dependent Clp protease ATP-binding subunit ClpA